MIRNLHQSTSFLLTPLDHREKGVNTQADGAGLTGVLCGRSRLLRVSLSTRLRVMMELQSRRNHSGGDNVGTCI